MEQSHLLSNEYVCYFFVRNFFYSSPFVYTQLADVVLNVFTLTATKTNNK